MLGVLGHGSIGRCPGLARADQLVALHGLAEDPAFGHHHVDELSVGHLPLTADIGDLGFARAAVRLTRDHHARGPDLGDGDHKRVGVVLVALLDPPRELLDDRACDRGDCRVGGYDAQITPSRVVRAPFPQGRVNGYRLIPCLFRHVEAPSTEGLNSCIPGLLFVEAQQFPVSAESAVGAFPELAGLPYAALFGVAHRGHRVVDECGQFGLRESCGMPPGGECGG
jgi:hypothetical protein